MSVVPRPVFIPSPGGISEHIGATMVSYRVKDSIMSLARFIIGRKEGWDEVEGALGLIRVVKCFNEPGRCYVFPP